LSDIYFPILNISSSTQHQDYPPPPPNLSETFLVYKHRLIVGSTFCYRYLSEQSFFLINLIFWIKFSLQVYIRICYAFLNDYVQEIVLLVRIWTLYVRALSHFFQIMDTLNIICQRTNLYNLHLTVIVISVFQFLLKLIRL